jgi:hypothetical protein
MKLSPSATVILTEAGLHIAYEKNWKAFVCRHCVSRCSNLDLTLRPSSRGWGGVPMTDLDSCGVDSAGTRSEAAMVPCS